MLGNAAHGVDFEEAWTGRVALEIDGLVLPAIGRPARLRNKRASGRPKDPIDVASLEAET